MRIAVLGAGAMGSLYGGILSNANEVYLVDIWEEHVKEINEHGLIIEEEYGDEVYHPHAVTSISNLPPMELVIIFVKSINTLEVVNKYKNIFTKDTLVLSLQNGYGNLEDIKTVVKEENIIIGTTSHGATILKPGKIIHAGVGCTVLGTVKKEYKRNADKVKDIFLNSKVETQISDDILYLIWNKLIINIGINPLTAILNIKNGKLLDSDYTLYMMKKLVDEAIDVAKSININFDKEEMFEKVKLVAKNTSNNKSSMLQDISKNRKTEIDRINGAVVSLGVKMNIPTPYNEAVRYIIKSKESLG